METKLMETEWWAYLHTNGTVQVKRMFDHNDIYEAQQSPFVEKAILLSATNRVDAVEEANIFFKGEDF